MFIVQSLDLWTYNLAQWNVIINYCTLLTFYQCFFTEYCH